MTRPGLLVLAVVVCVVPMVARADGADLEIARSHYATGTKYYNAQRYGEAVKEFIEAYRLAARADLLYNIGLSYEKLGDPGRATAYYERFLAAAPEATERTEIHAKLYDLSRNVGKLIVNTRAPHTELWIDDIRSDLPGDKPQPLTEGRHVVEVRLAGRLPTRAEVAIGAGRMTELALEPGDAAQVIVASPPEHVESTTTLALVPTGEPPPPPKRRWVVPVVVAVAVVVVAGVVVGALAATGGSDVRVTERTHCAASDCTLLDFGAH